MSPILIIAQKEIRDNLRNRWVIAATMLMFVLALALGFLGSAPTGSVKIDPLTVTVVSLSSLSIFLIPLIAMLMAYDALIGEIERGTMVAVELPYFALADFGGQIHWAYCDANRCDDNWLWLGRFDFAIQFWWLSGCCVETIFLADCGECFAGCGVFVLGLFD